MTQCENIKNVLSKEPSDLLNWLISNFTVRTPELVITMEDMSRASESLLKLSGIYTYLMTLVSYAKVMTREYKRSGDKTAHEDMVDRKEILQNYADAIKQEYQAVSRAVTIRIENNNELKMGRGVA